MLKAFAERRKRTLISALLHDENFAKEDREWLERLSLPELERLHIKVKCENGREYRGAI
ncbi:Fur-regulated basic protein FbpA [Bacillus sp. YC2]|uniref:Fur-regulated basic protein FbpA n=1 Tax=Bacillus sp. YC2 TaxID=2861287 RepID=UPI001CA61092|nr:Fur-regulated basic protein FbpA [Bacillus sp. YC2]MBY8913271.1 Fur-regulated basic protein FbpA [Bacillus sp. YC2]